MLNGLNSTQAHWIGDAFLFSVVESDCLKICKEYLHWNQWEKSLHCFNESNSSFENKNNYA